jgi:nucleoside-triphosphatase
MEIQSIRKEAVSMHIFLTGEIQSGKSTVLNRTLTLLNGEVGGFRTYFGPDRDQPNRCLYMSDAAEPFSYREENTIVRFRKEQPPEVLTERFDALGTRYLIKAEKTARTIIMDECGQFEKSAFRFQDQIVRVLDKEIPVLGVLRDPAVGWLEKIAAHPKVLVLVVDQKNRDALPQRIFAMLQAAM